MSAFVAAKNASACAMRCGAPRRGFSAGGVELLRQAFDLLDVEYGVALPVRDGALDLVATGGMGLFAHQ